MDKEVVLASLAAGASIVSAVIATVGTVTSSRNHEKLKDTTSYLNEIKISLDGRLDQLLSVTKSNSRAEGKVEEQSEAAQRLIDKTS